MGKHNVTAFSFVSRDDPVTEASLKTHPNSRELKSAIDKIVQKGGLSNVGE